MIFKTNYDMYESNIDLNELKNKLLCTFTTEEELDTLIKDVSRSYYIMYNKMFVLFVKSTNEYVLTYNIDQNNIDSIPDNTILVHRKKDTNSLYTINALNELIKRLNGGVVDTSYRINWQHYRNCILLTQHNELKQLNTKVHSIVEV